MGRILQVAKDFDLDLHLKMKQKLNHNDVLHDKTDEMDNQQAAASGQQNLGIPLQWIFSAV